MAGEDKPWTGNLWSTPAGGLEQMFPGLMEPVVIDPTQKILTIEDMPREEREAFERRLKAFDPPPLTQRDLDQIYY